MISRDLVEIFALKGEADRSAGLPRGRIHAGELRRFWLDGQRLGLHLAGGLVQARPAAVIAAQGELLPVGPKGQGQDCLGLLA